MYVRWSMKIGSDPYGSEFVSALIALLNALPANISDEDFSIRLSPKLSLVDDACDELSPNFTDMFSDCSTD